MSRNIFVYLGFILRNIPDIINIMKKQKDSAEIILGQRIRSLINLKGWTQQRLGHSTDVNNKLFGEIEGGK